MIIAHRGTRARRSALALLMLLTALSVAPRANADSAHADQGSWTRTGSMHGPRARHQAALLPNGQVLVAGGCLPPTCSTVVASAELYNPHTGAWTPTGSLTRARASLSMTLMPDGTVLATAGLGPNGYLASTELYTPSAGTWTTIAAMSMQSARDFETPATPILLPSGQILVAGDGGGGPGSLAGAELYNPATHIWTTAGSLHGPRSFENSVLLANGQVLVVGGQDATFGILPTAEIYHP